MPETYDYDDEIDLHALYRTLVDGRWLVAAFTAVAAVLSGVMSFFVIPPTYEAEARLATAPPAVAGPVAPSALAAGTLAVLAQSPSVLYQAAQTAGLGSVPSVSDRVDASVADDKATVVIKARARTAERAAALANAVAGEVAIRASLVQGASLAQAVQAKLADDLETRKSLAAALSSTPETLATTESLAEDPTFQRLVEERLGLPPSQAAQLEMRTEVVNPAWQSLAEKLADLDGEIAELQTELTAVRRAQESDSQAAEDFRRALGQEGEPAPLSLSLAGVSLLAPAVPPLEPSAPKKGLNVAVAAVLGAILGVFAVFFREFARNARRLAAGRTAVAAAAADAGGPSGEGGRS
ncbi:MAG: hypothetical protein IRZ11_05835 [Clostridia bacterium]|nr:hypothetical protein [Clostridia bacterium]